MISTGENLRASSVFAFNNRIRSVPANVMERVNVSLPVTAKNELKAGDLVFEPVSGLTESDLVGYEKPVFREDCSSFELIHLWTLIPYAGQSPRWGILIFGSFWATEEVVKD